MGRPRTILGWPDPCSRDAVTGACERPQRLPLGVGILALKGRSPPGMIRPRQTGQSASRGPSTKTYRPGPPGFCGRDLASQIWPALTLPVRPVGGVCARPRFRPNTCVFGLNLGRGHDNGRLVCGWRWSVFLGPLGRASHLRCSARSGIQGRLGVIYDNIVLTVQYSFV